MLSVVIPCYNDPHRLSCCLRGLAQQKHGYKDDGGVKPFEVILVNDGGDALPVDRLAREFQQMVGRRNVRVAVHHLPRSETFRAAAARNLGAREAQGERILFLDADCVASRNVLKAHDDYADFPIAVLGARHHIPEARVEQLNPETEKVWHKYSGQKDYDARYRLGGDYREAAHFLKRGHTCFPVNYAFCWSCHLSVPAQQFWALGGFWELEGYGSEDQELGWRLQQSGCTLLARFDLVVYHLDHPRRSPPDNLSATERRRQVMEASRAQPTLVRNGRPLR